MTFGSGKTAKEAQRDTMGDHFTPVPLDTDGTWKGEVKTATIRVWADDTYRAQNVHWQRTFEEQLAYANAVLAPKFGVQLRADYQVWNRHPGAGRLQDDLEALSAHDKGDGVFTVVGLTSALGLVSATFDELGMAQLGGRHLIMRGYANIEEREAFDRAFPDLEKSERESVLLARRAHKLASVLLHELGHNLGCDHDSHRDTIMYPHYSHLARAFTSDNMTTIRAEVDRRLGRGTAVAPADQRPVEAANPAPAGKPSSVTIFVSPKGEWIVDGKTLAEWDIDNLLVDTAAKDPATEIIIKRDKKTPADKLVEVIDRAKKVGLTNFTLGMN